MSERCGSEAAAKHRLLGSYKANAKTHGRLWQLSDTEFYALTKGQCAYCGCEPSQEYWCYSNRERFGRMKVTPTPYVYNGVDRVDSLAGYNLANCVPCCFLCNRAKNSLTLSDWLSWIDRLVKFQSSHA